MPKDRKDLSPVAPLCDVSRRGFLTAAAGGLVLATIAAPQAPQAQPAPGGGSSGGSGGGSGGGTTQGTRIRRNVYALQGSADGKKMIEAYRKGVQAMMAKPFSDVTSWRFQAAIHSPFTGDTADIQALPIALQAYLDPRNLCQHGNGRFLPWHRMYVYYFERIVRKASGEPAFCLPYWNYSDSPAERAIPEGFRTPADPAANALFRSARRAGINGGDALPPEIISTTDAFRETSAGPQRASSGFYAAIEVRPHNRVHVALGGDTGLMSDPETAALDPIFWMHHCNIDRLWTKWIRAGHANLTDTPFLDRVHRFWDEDGNAVEMTTREVMDTVTRLDYRYDDDTPTEAGTLTLAQAGGGVEAGPAATELAATAAPVTLSREGTTALAAPVVEAGGAEVFATRTPAQLDQPVILSLEDVRFATAPRTLFEVYVNPPETGDFRMDPAYFAGIFAPFAPPREGEEYRETFDITGLITRQIDAGIYQGGPLRVEILPRPPEEGTGVEAGPLPEVTVGRISVSR
ncbi:MAG: tyrosinase family protein [Paracoccaceae bacterium]